MSHGKIKQAQIAKTRFKSTGILVFLLLLSLAPSSLIAFGEYARGRKIIRVIKFESKGIVWKSWEGIAEEATYNPKEKCNKETDECYTPTMRQFKFSVREKNDRVTNFIRKNINREMLILYVRHRIKPMSLATDLEITNVYARKDKPPQGFLRRLVVKQTGSARNFSVYGRILKLEYIGTAVGTYEGLYYNMRKSRVHPFSIVNARIAKYAYNSMLFKQPLYIGISKAYVSGFRKSAYDFFELNYDEDAGGSVAPKAKKK